MGDMGDIYRDMREDRRQRAEQRMHDNNAFIEDMKARAFSFGPLPGGWRLQFVDRNGYLVVFDYWPTRGKWCEHRDGKQLHRQGESAMRQRLDECGDERALLEPLDAGLRRILARSVHCGQ